VTKISTMRKTILFLTLFCFGYLNAQIAFPTPDFALCDDISNDGIETVDLSIFNSTVLGSQNPSLFSVSYHVSQQDAVNGMNSLSSPYTISIGVQTLFTRVEDVSNTALFDQNFLDLILALAPVINFSQQIFDFCGTATSNGVTADLRQIEPFLSSSPQSGIVYSYYSTQQDAGSATNAIPFIFEALAFIPTTIFIRAEAVMNSDCFDTTSVDGVFIANCDGIRVQSILGVNLNGIVDASDLPFLAGIYDWEKNNDGNVIQIATTEATYSIFDSNPVNMFDLGYSVLPAYAANYSVSPASYSGQTIPAGSGITTRDFLIIPLSVYEDVVVYIIPQQQPRPGFTYKERVGYANLGTTLIAAGQLQYTYDTQLSIVAVDDAAAVIGATTVDLNYTNLLPFEYRTMEIEMQIPNIPAVNLRDLLTNLAVVSPISSDLTPSNNTNTSVQIIIGSYDPNDKMESRGEFINPAEFGPNDYFFYTVRFENTGTASAINVRIEDTLDAQLDWNSIEMIDASHNYVMERIEEQVVWRFDTIMLPDATTDPVGANGYVYFKIKPLAFSEGTAIPNTAEIYFDFNPAIITNTFTSTFRTPLSNPDVEETVFSLTPNSASNQIRVNFNHVMQEASITLYDLRGRVRLLQKLTQNQLQIDISEFKKGVYLAKFVHEDQTYTSKLIKK
jgi:uncharacterized repeat protein (TIGR01451 family)